MNYHVTFYVPIDHCENVKQAMFIAGAGTIGNYEQCSWQVLGTGQFKPVNGSQPFLGETNILEKLEEFKVEMICDAKKIDTVIQALKSSHPYEVPAYTVTSVIDI